MPDTVTQSQAAPLVTFRPPAKTPSLFEQIRIARENGMATIPVGAYQNLFFPMAKNNKVVVLSDPAGVKHVLLDNVANYPKTPSDAPFLSAAFGDGLLTLEGEKWKAHRRLMSPSFDHRSIVSYAPGMVEATRHFVESWDQRGPGAEIDIAEAMTELTLKIITRAMFSSDSGGITELFGKTFDEGLKEMEFGLADILPIIGPRHLQGRIKKIRAVFSRLDSAVYKLIDERVKAGGEGKADLLGRLIAARDVETGAALTNQEIRDEMVIIFIAGHETTAVAMTFAFYILSQRPEVEARLHEELDRVLGGRMPVYDDLANLPYTRQVIDETMRLYPPAPGLSGRQAQADDEVCGQKIPKGAQMFIAPWIIHHHEKLWENPYEFDPDRFTADKVKARPRFAHMPFGGGPRVCIGASLAMTEACLILATIAQRYRLALVPNQQISIRSRITLRPHPGIRMTLSRRGS
ncbi:MAG TPA: cytochrome P450 [Hyphomonadaceae bacterium]|nr:cytochrome P450 [Hyphomonadaceae bacterium]